MNLVKRELEKDRGTAVFIYDSWAHQGDALRRSFLELLADFLATPEFKWLGRRSAAKLKKCLSGQHVSTVTRTTPRFTRVGVVAAMLTFALPLGYLLIGARHARWGFGVAGWILAIIPILAGALFLFTNWRRLGNNPSPTDGTCSEEDPRADLAALLLRDVRQEVHTRAVSSPQPTSVEFARLFHDVIEASFTPDPKRKLVVVIDNLDRIEESQARAAWATMSGFFEKSGTKHADDTLNRLWLLVPFAPEALKRLWRDADSDSTPASGDTFRDKTFQVRLHVPPQMQAEWRQYFVRKLREAIPCVTNDMLAQRVYRVFSRYGHFDASPTPRDIKLFINRLVALHMVSGHDIPLVYMALYVLHEAEISRDGRELRHELIADTDAQVMDAPDWRKNLAALHFGVPVDDSLTILFGRDIENALISGDSTRLAQLLTDDACREICYQRVQALVEGWTKQPSLRELLTFI